MTGTVGLKLKDHIKRHHARVQSGMYNTGSKWYDIDRCELVTLHCVNPLVFYTNMGKCFMVQVEEAFTRMVKVKDDNA